MQKRDFAIFHHMPLRDHLLFSLVAEIEHNNAFILCVLISVTLGWTITCTSKLIWCLRWQRGIVQCKIDMQDGFNYDPRESWFKLELKLMENCENWIFKKIMTVTVSLCGLMRVTFKRFSRPSKKFYWINLEMWQLPYLLSEVSWE